MLDLVGDSLNWAAAGILFPLMLLPAATLISGNSSRATLIWVFITFGIISAGILFAAIVPILRATPTLAQFLPFSGLFSSLVIIIALTGGAREAVRRLTPILETLTKAVGRAVIWFLLAMALIQFGVVIGRYVFGVNSLFIQESITYFHGAVFLLATGYALLTDDHVRVDIFYREASSAHKAKVDLAGAYFLLFPICLLLLWAASPYVAQSWLVREGSAEASGIQALFVLKSLIPAYAVLLAMAGFVTASNAVETLREHR